MTTPGTFVSVELGQPGQLVEVVRPDVLVLGSAQGPAGVPGVAGLDGQSAVPNIAYYAGEAIGGGRAVYIDGGVAYYADKDNTSADAVLGITLNAASIAGSLNIRYIGVIVEPSWAWTPGEPVYLSTNGMLTQVAPTTGALVELGVALTATSLNIRIQEAVFLT